MPVRQAPSDEAQRSRRRPARAVEEMREPPEIPSRSSAERENHIKGGIETAAEDFARSPTACLAQLDVGGGQLTEFYDQLNEIDRQLRTTLTVERGLSAQCARAMFSSPARTAPTRLGGRCLVRGSSVASRSAQIGGPPRQGTGPEDPGPGRRKPTPLQIGDITRQRIEHVQSGLKVLSEVSTDTHRDARDRSVASRAPCTC